jgi:hypothetical protein
MEQNSNQLNADEDGRSLFTFVSHIIASLLFSVEAPQSLLGLTQNLLLRFIDRDVPLIFLKRVDYAKIY